MAPALADDRPACPSPVGAHLSISGGLHHTVAAADALGFDALQIFTRNQQQWHAGPLSQQALADWTAALARSPRLRPATIFAHASYLPNLASPDEQLRQKSVHHVVDELQRVELLGLAGLVIHPGAAGKDGPQAGLERLIDSLQRIRSRLSGLKTRLLLETTAGQGTTLGHQTAHFASVFERLADNHWLGVCIDTAHLFAAGYDYPHDPAALLEEMDRAFGLHRIGCIHANDSARPLASRVDRHAHIGHGLIGEAGLAALLSDPRLRGIPAILETEPGTDAHGHDWHALDAAALRRCLAGNPRPAAATLPRDQQPAQAAHRFEELSTMSATKKSTAGKSAPAKSKTAKTKTAAKSAARPKPATKPPAKPADRAAKAPQPKPGAKAATKPKPGTKAVKPAKPATPQAAKSTKPVAKPAKAAKAVKPAKSARPSAKPPAIEPGSPAPDFTATAHGPLGPTLSLSSLRGKPAVLYFYPADDTPKCTTQACTFRDALPAFDALNVPIIGISPDSPESHARFAAKHSLPFTLVSDPDQAICRAYGVWVQKNMYGKLYMGVARTTFIVDADGVIRSIIRQVRLPGHDQQVLEAMSALG